MCNLYKMRRSTAEVAQLFRVDDVAAFNAAEEIFPGYTAMVVREIEGRRQLDGMTWGFPRIMKSKRTGLPIKPKPVNNARDDKLLTPFWKSAFESRRCLIPLTEWAEAEGETGKMTATWYSVPDVNQFTVAGLWRPTAEWGDAYTMVMVDGSPQMSDVHDRMPVILAPKDHDAWLTGSPDEALALVRTYTGDLVVDRTQELWGRRRAKS